jgi:drug/metabolite transporter (DMT)-like permease
MHTVAKNSWFSIIAGIVFTFFWGSGSTITKFGLQYLQPWVLAICRLITAATIMLVITHLILGHAIPHRKQWSSIFIYKLLNLGIFLEMYNYALQYV